MSENQGAPSSPDQKDLGQYKQLLDQLVEVRLRLVPGHKEDIEDFSESVDEIGAQVAIRWKDIFESSEVRVKDERKLRTVIGSMENEMNNHLTIYLDKDEVINLLGRDQFNESKKVADGVLAPIRDAMVPLSALCGLVNQGELKQKIDDCLTMINRYLNS